jgi:hypothetical protein
LATVVRSLINEMGSYSNRRMPVIPASRFEGTPIFCWGQGRGECDCRVGGCSQEIYMTLNRRLTRTLGFAAVASAIAVVPFGVATGTASADNGHDWDAVAQCESGGNWNTQTGNGFSGGLQFTPSTWAANGGSGNPANASRAEQIRVAENVFATQGAGAWPVCGAYL